MPANFLDISDASIPLPEFIILDASIVLELTPEPAHPHKNHVLAVNFLHRINGAAQQGGVKPVLPLLAFEECYFKIAKRILESYGKLAGVPWHIYYKQNPQSIRSALPALAQLYNMLLAFPIEITEPEDLAILPKGRERPLSLRMGEMIDSFSILPKDATIISEAERLGIKTLATLDSDWSRADGFTVFAPLTL